MPRGPLEAGLLADVVVAAAAAAAPATAALGHRCVGAAGALPSTIGVSLPGKPWLRVGLQGGRHGGCHYLVKLVPPLATLAVGDRELKLPASPQ